METLYSGVIVTALLLDAVPQVQAQTPDCTTDTTAPVIMNCPEDSTFYVAPGEKEKLVFWEKPTVIDDCTPDADIVRVNTHPDLPVLLRIRESPVEVTSIFQSRNEPEGWIIMNRP